MTTAVDLSNDPVVVGKLTTFRTMTLGRQAQELDDFDAAILAARGSGPGLLMGQTREQTDTILTSMLTIVNDQLPEANRFNLASGTVQTMDVVDAARAYARRR